MAYGGAVAEITYRYKVGALGVEMKQSLAVITARGGSKRIPGKNIKEFCGKPIIAYSIEAALESGVFDEIMVSTDSREIAEIAIRYGASVPFMRSTATADDYATTSEVLLEVIGQYEKRAIFFDVICCIYPTAPFVTGEKLAKAMELLKMTDVDTVIPVTAFSYSPQRGMIMNGKYIEMKYPEYMDTRTQDLEKIYHDSGQFYCFETDSFKKNKRLMAGNVVPLVLPEMEVQDIDTLEDWKMAELKYRMMKKE